MPPTPPWSSRTFNSANPPPYSVAISNAFGAVVSRNAIVVVGPPPTRLQVIPSVLPGTFQFFPSGEVGHSYRIEASTNLSTWSLLQEVSLPSGEKPVTDATVSGLPWRFCRAVKMP